MAASSYSPEFYAGFKPELYYAQHPQLMDTFTKRMQPGKWSQVGFLDPGQNLAEICQKDAETLKARGISHEQIADRLEAVIMKANFLFQQHRKIKHPVAVIEDKIGIPKDEYVSTLGHQECPFTKDLKNRNTICGKGSSMITLINLVSKKRLENITELHPHLIKDHHFFEGKHPYRLDPALAIEVLGIEPGVDYKVKTVSEMVWEFSQSSNRMDKEKLQAAREHKLEAIVSEGGEFEAYLLLYSEWGSYKYRGLTNKQKIEKQGAENNKTPGEIQKDIESYLDYEKGMRHLDGSPIKSSLDELVWTSEGQQYLHIFKFADLTDKDKSYKIGNVPITGEKINQSEFAVYRIDQNVYPLLSDGDKVEDLNKDCILL